MPPPKRLNLQSTNALSLQAQPLREKPTMQASLIDSGLRRVCYVVAFVATILTPGRGDELPVVRDIEFQPLSAQVKRVIEALTILGEPLSREETDRLERAID